jgi:hypothetical protein
LGIIEVRRKWRIIGLGNGSGNGNQDILPNPKALPFDSILNLSLFILLILFNDPAIF